MALNGVEIAKFVMGQIAIGVVAASNNSLSG
jgi:hypothetical protein